MNSTISAMLIISILLILLFLSAHIYNRGNKERTSTRLKFRRIIARKKIKFWKKEIVNDQFIGVDDAKKNLVITDLNNSEDLLAISLPEVAYCKLDKRTKEVVHRGRNRTVSEKLLEKISLLLYSAHQDLLAEIIFFDQEKNEYKDLPYLTRRAEYWKTLVKKTGVIEAV